MCGTITYQAIPFFGFIASTNLRCLNNKVSYLLFHKAVYLPFMFIYSLAVQRIATVQEFEHTYLYVKEVFLVRFFAVRAFGGVFSNVISVGLFLCDVYIFKAKGAAKAP